MSYPKTLTTIVRPADVDAVDELRRPLAVTRARLHRLALLAGIDALRRSPELAAQLDAVTPDLRTI